MRCILRHTHSMVNSPTIVSANSGANFTYDTVNGTNPQIVSVIARTAIGGKRVVIRMVGEQLPRIC